ncbi:MAG: glycoside hydrolase family 13 protein [Trueperaceae bacterium]
MNKLQRDRELQMPQGEVLPLALSHYPSRREDFDIRGDGLARLRIRAEAGAIRSAEIVCLGGDWPEPRDLTLRYRDRNEELWESEALTLFECREYYFRLQTVTGQALFGSAGLQGSVPCETRFRAPAPYRGTPPQWSRGAAFYQIFPDRFCNLETSSEGKGSGAGIESWDSPPSGTGFKGGSLAGITAKLDYVESLGIEAIWLNPIFSSPSNHRYDATDFYAIDPRLGNDEDLGTLTERAHERGIRVVLDGVFNHVSDEHPFFQDVVCRGMKSPYWEWFRIKRWPIAERTEEYYGTWWGHGHLPQLNLENPQVQQYFLDVGEHWIRKHDIDGWRLDVAAEVPLAFWRSFREAIRGVKPDAYLLAEVWGDGRLFLQGDTFDATMNYPFRRAVLEFLGGRIDAEACAGHLNRLYYRYPRETAEAQYNLLGSHDVSRLRHDLGGDTGLVEVAWAIQCAYPGATALYYGDELGLDGRGDPGCREAFPWNRVGSPGTSAADSSLTETMSGLLSRRKREPALKFGLLHCAADGEHRLRIVRTLAEESIALSADRRSRSYTWER